MEKTRKHTLLWTTLILLSIALIFLLLYLFVWRWEEYTDDCYVSGNFIPVHPQVDGIIASVNVDNTDLVETGAILFKLDQTDFLIALDRSKANLAETVREVKQMFDQVKELEGELIVREAELIKAEQDYAHRVPLVDIGGVSLEDFEHIQAELRSAKGALDATYFRLEGLKARVAGTTIPTHPLVLSASQVLKDAYVNLKRTEIRAPVAGYIAQRNAQVGQQIDRRVPLVAIVPLNEIWIDANYKENQLARMRVGQRVKLTSDIYGRSVIFHGRVMGMNPGTGAVFSILPPQNATGNWIKIVQRVPIRITLDPDEIKAHPLVLGMSMESHVDLTDQSGPQLRPSYPLKPLYISNIYPKQEEGAEQMIHEIIRANS